MPSTVAVTGAWSLQSTNNALAGRYHDGAFLALDGASGTPLGTWKSGVVTTVSSGTQHYDLWVQQQVSPNMSVLVQQGYAVLSRAGQGPYTAYSAATATLTVAASNPTNPRIDLVYLQVLDNALGDGSTVAQLGIVTGTPAGSPSVPALPLAGVCIPLAQIAVAALAASIVQANITDVRQSAAVAGPPRILLPGDSAATAGRRVGEERQRVLSSYGNAVSTDYWGVDGAWHGTSELPIPTTSYPLAANASMNAGGATYILGQTTVPDPGWAYRVRVDAKSEFYNFSAISPQPVNVRLDVASSGTIIAAGGTSAQTNWATCSLCGGLSAVLTGAHTVYFVYQPLSSPPTCNYPGNNGAVWCNVAVIPV